MKTKTICGKLENVTYFDTSFVGNPRYSCTLASLTVYSSPNSRYSITMRNMEGKQVVAQIRELRGKLVFESLQEAPIEIEKDSQADYIKGQFDKIIMPNLNHIAGKLLIKGDCGGQTNWLDISAKQLEAIQKILVTLPNHNQ